MIEFKELTVVLEHNSLQYGVRNLKYITSYIEIISFRIF